MPLPPGAEPPKPLEPGAGGLVSRIAETAKNIITVSEQLARLAREDERLQSQVIDLTKMVFSLSKDTATVLGQMQNIEKRLEDREKLMELTIVVRVREEVEKAMKGWKPPDDA
jgi:hypothetical protein